MAHFWNRWNVNDSVEYREGPLGDGGVWAGPAKVSQVNPDGTYFITVENGPQILQPADRLRAPRVPASPTFVAPAFKKGDLVEYCKISVGGAWLPARIETVTPLGDGEYSYYISLQDGSGSEKETQRHNLRPAPATRDETQSSRRPNLFRSISGERRNQEEEEEREQRARHATSGPPPHVVALTDRLSVARQRLFGLIRQMCAAAPAHACRELKTDVMGINEVVKELIAQDRLQRVDREDLLEQSSAILSDLHDLLTLSSFLEEHENQAR